MAKAVERVTVVGTGILGTQIAMLSAYAGKKVKACDIREGAFIATYSKIYNDLKTRGINPFIPWEKWAAARDGVKQIAGLAEAIEDADLVIEAVPENLELKKKLFEEIGQYAPQGAVLATNSSSLPISKIEAGSGRPEYCLNIHFYLPLQGMNMVDIMGGTKTLPEVFDRGVEYIRSLGCVPLKVEKEILGFCFNSVWRAIKRQTLYLWANGFVAFQDVDRAWMIFTQMNEGPFALMDKVGLDVVYDIEMVYYRESNDPKDKPPEALLEKVKKGELGVKSGKGFYTYPNPEFLRPDFIRAKR